MKPKHPLQPVIKKDGLFRFKENAIVQALLEEGPFDMNGIGLRDFPREDRVQFAQLIGYTLDGFGQLPYVKDADYDAARETVAMQIEAAENDKKAKKTKATPDQSDSGYRRWVKVSPTMHVLYDDDDEVKARICKASLGWEWEVYGFGTRSNGIASSNVIAMTNAEKHAFPDSKPKPKAAKSKRVRLPKGWWWSETNTNKASGFVYLVNEKNSTLGSLRLNSPADWEWRSYEGGARPDKYGTCTTLAAAKKALLKACIKEQNK